MPIDAGLYWSEGFNVEIGGVNEAENVPRDRAIRIENADGSLSAAGVLNAPVDPDADDAFGVVWGTPKGTTQLAASISVSRTPTVSGEPEVTVSFRDITWAGTVADDVRSWFARRNVMQSVASDGDRNLMRPHQRVAGFEVTDSSQMRSDLTGTWIGNDDTHWYVTQSGDDIVMLGEHDFYTEDIDQRFVETTVFIGKASQDNGLTFTGIPFSLSGPTNVPRERTFRAVEGSELRLTPKEGNAYDAGEGSLRLLRRVSSRVIEIKFDRFELVTAQDALIDGDEDVQFYFFTAVNDCKSVDPLGPAGSMPQLYTRKIGPGENLPARPDEPYDIDDADGLLPILYSWWVGPDAEAQGIRPGISVGAIGIENDDGDASEHWDRFNLAVPRRWDADPQTSRFTRTADITLSHGTVFSTARSDWRPLGRLDPFTINLSNELSRTWRSGLSIDQDLKPLAVDEASLESADVDHVPSDVIGHATHVFDHQTISAGNGSVELTLEEGAGANGGKWRVFVDATLTNRRSAYDRLP